MSMFAHVSIGVNDLQKSKDFYDAVMSALGYAQCTGAIEEYYIGYGHGDSFFIINTPLDEAKSVTPANGNHICFKTSSQREVDAFYAAALKMGGKDSGAPGIREHYCDDYYAAYVYDLDGHKIEALARVKGGE